MIETLSKIAFNEIKLHCSSIPYFVCNGFPLPSTANKCSGVEEDTITAYFIVPLINIYWSILLKYWVDISIYKIIWKWWVLLKIENRALNRSRIQLRDIPHKE